MNETFELARYTCDILLVEEKILSKKIFNLQGGQTESQQKLLQVHPPPLPPLYLSLSLSLLTVKPMYVEYNIRLGKGTRETNGKSEGSKRS